MTSFQNLISCLDQACPNACPAPAGDAAISTGCVAAQGATSDAGADVDGADAAIEGTDARPDALALDGAPTDAGSDTSVDVTSASDTCGGTAGPKMVRVSGGYCIDSTEITNLEYAAFLDAKAGDTSGQSAKCSWNTTYVPSSQWPPTLLEEFTLPVVYVDWCDAVAYCAWAGKRLCGKIGGGPNAYEDFADATRSQWYAACSAGGTRQYATGNTYVAGTCADGYVMLVLPAGELKSCEGGYCGVFDMSGNVTEWEDSCETVNGGTYCRLRGALECAYEEHNYWTDTASMIGFRCCSR